MINGKFHLSNTNMNRVCKVFWALKLIDNSFLSSFWNEITVLIYSKVKPDDKIYIEIQSCMIISNECVIFVTE